MDVVSDAEDEKYDDNGNYREHSGEAGFRARPDVFAMGIAAVTEIRGDDSAVVALLERGVFELVSARTPAEYGFFLNHAERGCPAVDALHIGSVGADVRHRLDVFHEVARRILAVAAHFVENVVGVEEKQRSDHQSAADDPRQFDAQFEDYQYPNGHHQAEPCGAAERQVETRQQNQGNDNVENPLREFVIRQEDKADGERQHEG